nr:uncharacterized protein LOC129267390 [Lytechinus pictus]
MAEDMSPSKYDDEFEPYLRKIEDIKSYLRKNVKYLGKEDELVKDSKQNTYVLYVPTYSNVKVEEKNKKLFLRLSSTFSGNEACVFIVVDQEIVSSHVWPHVVKGPAIKKYGQGTCECEDLYQEMGQPLEVCMIQMENPVPVISIPKDRTCVKLRCPNALTKAGSSDEVPKWRCSKCRQLVEYGTTTKLFYCNCGQSDPDHARYRCNDLHHSINFVMYPKDLLLPELSKLKAMKEMNILILGEAGVGKSTWINSLQNYGSFTSFAEAMNYKKLNVLIPCSFSITQGGRSQTIKMQVSTNNEKVGQLTREPRSYVVNIDDMRLCLIDTPSISDVGGNEQLTTWMKKLMDYLLSYSEINAICIILKPNSTQLTEMFRLYVEEFLAHLHISAKDNIVFCFTHTRPTLYQPGDTLPAINKELKRKNVGIQATKDRYYCFDNEPFRFLACNQHDVTFGDGEASIYLLGASWDKSVEETRRLLNYIVSRMKPHRVKETIDVNDVRRITLALSELLRKVANRIKRNYDAMKKANQELSEEGTILESVRENKTPKGYDKKQELKCRKQAFIIATSKKCEHLKAENETIIEAGAKFDSFLKTNLITCNIEPFVENLDICIKFEKEKHVTLRDNVTLDAMKEMKLYYTKKRKIIEKNTGQNIKTLAQVNEVLESLFKLLHLGSSVKALTEEIMRGP